VTFTSLTGTFEASILATVLLSVSALFEPHALERKVMIDATYFVNARGFDEESEEGLKSSSFSSGEAESQSALSKIKRNEARPRLV
jgi:hypothetical protein